VWHTLSADIYTEQLLFVLLPQPFVNPSSTIVTKGSNLSHSKHVSEHHLFCGLPPFKFACKCFYFPLTRSSPVMCVFVCVKRNRNSQISNFKLHFLFYSLFMDFLFNRKQIDFGKMNYFALEPE